MGNNASSHSENHPRFAFLRLSMRHWKRLPGRVIGQINNDRVGLTAAGIAFYALLAIFPGLAAVVSLWGLFADPATISEEISSFSAILPGEVASGPMFTWLCTNMATRGSRLRGDTYAR